MLVRRGAYFLAADAFFAAAFLVGVAAALFGLGALGFLVGGLAVFLALGAAALFALAGVAAFFGAGFFLAAAAFLSFVAAEGFDLAGDEATADFLPLPPLAAAEGAAAFFDLADEAAPLSLAPADLPEALEDAGFLEEVDFDSSLKLPEAPLPLVWINAPDSTALFKYFLMNGASFSASTLY